MKKTLFVIPLVALLLVGCSGNNSKKRKVTSVEPTSLSTSEPTSDSTQESQKTTSYSNQIIGTSTIPHAEEVEAGKNHSLPWNIDYENFKDPDNALSYWAYNKTYGFDGTNIYAYGMRAVTDISVNLNGSLITFKGFKIVHLCKLNHDTWVDGGQLQISQIQPSKLVLELVSHQKNGNYVANKTMSVYVNDSKITPPASATSSVSAVNEVFNVQTIIFDINATEPSTVKIKNEQSFSMYIQSIRFE